MEARRLALGRFFDTFPLPRDSAPTLSGSIPACSIFGGDNLMDYDLATRKMLLKRSRNCCEQCGVHNDIGPNAAATRGRRLFVAEGAEGPIVVCGECREKGERPAQMELF
jgi:hypothetical protein